MSLTSLGTGDGVIYLRKPDNSGPLDDTGFIGVNKTMVNGPNEAESVKSMAHRGLPSGPAASGYRFRVFVDITVDNQLRPLPDFNVATAVEVTEELLIRGRNNPPVKTSVTISSNSIEYKRVVDHQVVEVSGAAANPDLTSATITSAYVGDRINIRLAAATDPFKLKANPVFVIGRDMQFGNTLDSIELEVTGVSPLELREVYRNEVYEGEPEKGVYDWTVPTSGTLTVQPRTYNAVRREQNIRLSGTVTAVANLAIQLDTTNLLPGDSGTIEGGTSAITLGSNELTVTDGTTSVQVRPSQALSGDWLINWKWDGTNTTFNLVSSRGVGQGATDDYFVFTVDCSYASGELIKHRMEFPFDWEVVSVSYFLLENMGTIDAGSITLEANTNNVAIPGLTHTIPASTVATVTTPTVLTPSASVPIPANALFSVWPSKVTANGGRVRATVTGRKL